ncbi:MAG: hypothetical protein ACKV19_02205 [Verrucomicrobiales bacterium]
MRRFHNHSWFLLVALAMPALLAAAVRAQDPAAPAAPAAAPAAPAPAGVKGGDDILLTGERLFNEERRQLDVSSRLTGVHRRLSTLLEDLQSNELAEEGGAATLVTTGNAIATLRNGRVPSAAEQLRKARGDLGKALPHIDGADKEITAIVEDLNKIIAGASTILADDRLLKEIREIIKDEEFLRRQTAEWGKKLILTPEAGNLDQGRVSRAQQTVIDRYVPFFDMLTTARKQATDLTTASRLGKAEQVLIESKPEARLAAAIDQITQSKAIGAVGEQDQAIDALRKAEKILAEEAASDFVTELARILAAEKELHQDTTQAEAAAFQAEKSQFEARQIGIDKMIETAISNFLPSLAGTPAAPPPTPAPTPAPTFTTPPVSAQLAASITEANKAVAVAVTELNAGNQPESIAAELAVIAALEKAIAQARAEMGTEVPPVEAGDISLADIGTGGEGLDSFGEGFDSFGGSDSFAEGFGEGQGVGQGQGEGQGQGKGKARGRGQPTPFAGDPKDLEESYADGRTDIGGRGADVKRTRQSLDALSRRQRSAAIQNFVQQLPPEFRQQVADYYETLAE